jgi:hypothetical protein
MPPVRVRALLRADLLSAACMLLATFAPLAGAARLMTWNVLNYPTSFGAEREDDYRVVIGNAAPDIVVMQEIVDTA